MTPAFARRTPQQQPLTASGRPKRATILKKEALKEEEEEAKLKAQKEKEKEKSEDEKKKVNQGRQKGATKKTKADSSKDVKSDVNEEESSDKICSSADEPVKGEKALSGEEATKKPVSTCVGKKDENKDVHEIRKVDINPEEVEEEEVESDSDPDDGEVDDEEDKDFDPDDDPEKLWCFCKKPHGNRFMICCDSCEDWFHGDCIGITMERGREMEKTGEEWCCNSCAEKKAKAEMKRISEEKKGQTATSPLNTPLSSKKQLDIPITKARNISLDSMKANLAKSLKSSEKLKAVSDGDRTFNEEKAVEQGKPEDGIKLEIVTPEKPASSKDKEKEKDVSKPKRRESNKQEFRDLLTFDQIPMKKDDSSKKKTQEQSNDRKQERHDSQTSDDDYKKRKKEETKKATSTKVRSNSQSKPPEPPKLCVRSECNRPVMKGAIYCSRECIYKYANESLKYIEEEKKKNKDPDMKQESAKGTVICPATSSTDRVSETTQERIAVFEKSSGKVVAGVMAPTKKYLFAWLEEHPSYEVLKPGKQPSDIKNSKNQDEVIRSNVRKSLRDILVLRCKETEMAINHEVVGKLSKQIENELLKMFNNETGQKYKTKYRSLIFNLKDRQNKILYKRVVSGEISPRKLVQMSPEQLATPELAQWRQQENKHHLDMVKKRELDDAEIKKNPPIKKTHKGEVVIDEEKVAYDTLLELKSAPIVDRKPKSMSSEMENLLKDTTDEHTHHLFDSNCKICTGKVAPPGESQVSGVSTTIIQAVPESSMPSPQLDGAESYVSSSPPSPDTSSLTSPAMSPSPTPRPPSTRKQPSVWRGFIMMQKVAKFVCTAYAVSGSCESLMDILPDSIHVCGRIPPSQVWDYLGLLREGRKSHYKYLDVIRFEMSSDEEKSGYIKLYTYFYTRQRIGVIGNCYSGIKDIYILPLASHDPIPTELRPLPGLPKPRPHMLLGIIVRVKTKKTKGSEFVDSSPEMVVPKKKKKKKDKKKEKETAKDTDKEKTERDLERERAEITLERERVELEAQKKLIDIIFKNRANEGAITPETLIQASAISGSVPSLAPLVQSPQLVDSLKSIIPTEQLTTAAPQCVGGTMIPSGNEKIAEEHKQIEEEQLKKLKEQQEEILKLQSEVGSAQQQQQLIQQQEEQKLQAEEKQLLPEKVKGETDEDEVVMIPDPESFAKNIRETVLNQISEAILEVSEPEEQMGSVGVPSVDSTSQLIDSTTDAVEMNVERTIIADSAVDSIVTLRNINASLVRPLTMDEKEPLFKAWLERPTNVNPIAQPGAIAPLLLPDNDLVPAVDTTHSSGSSSPSLRVATSSGYTSPTSGIDQVHVQNLLSSISSSIAHVQAMVATQPNDITSSDGGISVQSSSEPIESTSTAVPEKSISSNFDDASDLYSSHQDIDKDVLQDIEERFRPVSSFEEERITSNTLITSDISPPSSPTGSVHSIPGVVDISPPSKEELSPSRSTSPIKPNTIPLVGTDDDDRQKSDDDFALDLIEDIKIPKNIPRRATLFSLDLIKMRAGIKMPELPDIKLPDKNDCKSSAPVTVPPPIPAVIPTVPIPPDIKLPPGVPFPPLPPAPPPTSDNTGAIPVVIDPVEDIRSVWTSTCQPNPHGDMRTSWTSTSQSIAGIRPVSSIPISSVDVPRFSRPPTIGINQLLERPPLSDTSIIPASTKSILPIRSTDNHNPPFRNQIIPGDIKPGEPGFRADPLFRGTHPALQNAPGLRPGLRLPGSRLMEPNRFPPPGPPGPLPQRPLVPNRFPESVLSARFLPPVELPPDRFPLNQPMSPERGLCPLGKSIDNPMLRAANPRGFDVRVGPRFDHPSKFPETHERARDPSFGGPMFDVPRPRRPLEPQLNVDRAERIPTPFEPRGPPDVPRPPFGPEMKGPPFVPDGLRPLFGPEMRPTFDPEIHRPPFESERSRSPFEPDSHRVPFKPEHPPNSRMRIERSPPPRDSGRPYHDDAPYYDDYEDNRRDRRHDRTDYERSDPGYQRSNRGKFYHKNRQKFSKYDRHGPSYDDRRDTSRSSEFRYRSKHDDDRDRDRYDKYGGRDDGPSKAKQKRKSKYSTSTDHDELEEGEVL